MTPAAQSVLHRSRYGELFTVVVGKRHRLSLWRCLRLSAYCAFAWLVIFGTMGFFAYYALLGLL